jgi:hypothetical protein
MKTWQFRHVLGWAFTLGLIFGDVIDRTTSAAHGDAGMFVFLLWVIVAVIASAIVYLVRTLRNWEQLGAAQTISRSLLIFTFLLGFLAWGLFEARRWGVHIEACRTVGELETCQGPASPRQVLGMLAWHAANVVPVLDITHSLEWPRPARSANAVVGASILALRLWVAIGILGVLKLLWDKWGPIGSSRKSTDRRLTHMSPASTEEAKDK